MSSVNESSSSSWLVNVVRACCGSRRTVVAKASETTLEIQKYIEELKTQTNADKEKIKSLEDANKLRERDIEVLTNLLDKDETFQKANEIVSNKLVPKINARNQKLADLAEAEEAAKKEEEAAAEEEKMQQALLNMLNQRRAIPVQNTNHNRFQFQNPLRSQPTTQRIHTNYNNYNNNNSISRDDELESLLGNYGHSNPYHNNRTSYLNDNINNVNDPVFENTNQRAHSNALVKEIEAEFKNSGPQNNRNRVVVGWTDPGRREAIMKNIILSKGIRTDAEFSKILYSLSPEVQKQLPGIFGN